MELKTFTFTARETNCSCDAPGPNSSLVSLATQAKPCNKPSKAQPAVASAHTETYQTKCVYEHKTGLKCPKIPFMNQFGLGWPGALEDPLWYV